MTSCDFIANTSSRSLDNIFFPCCMLLLPSADSPPSSLNSPYISSIRLHLLQLRVFLLGLFKTAPSNWLLFPSAYYFPLRVPPLSFSIPSSYNPLLLFALTLIPLAINLLPINFIISYTLLIT